jgi:hypothetical protein
VKQYRAKVAYTDVRVITIEAESLEDAMHKFEEGDFANEETVVFYLNNVIDALTEADDDDERLRGL